MKIYTFFSVLVTLSVNLMAGEITIRLKPDEADSVDTYVRRYGSGYPDYSTIRMSNREEGSSIVREGFINFPQISSLPSTVKSVILGLYCTRVVTNRNSYVSLNVREPRSSWNENMDWDEVPSSSSIFFQRIYRSDVYDWVDLNLTSIYSKLRSNRRGLHLVASGSGEACAFESSSESDSEEWPELDITLTFPDLVYPVANRVNGKWVRDKYSSSKINNGGHFGDHWENQYSEDGYPLLHTGIDLKASAGTPVYAIHSGVIRNIPREYNHDIGPYMSIEYQYNGFTITSTYHHVIPDVNNGIRVTAGNQIATVYNLSSGSHLHVQMRYGDSTEEKYGFPVVTVGRLPEKKDNTLTQDRNKTGILPAFPEWFINLSQDAIWER